MKRTSLLFAIILATSAASICYADVAPMPAKGTYMAMKWEKVVINVGEKSLAVTADFKLGGTDLPRLQYCRHDVEGEVVCGKEHYRFFYIYPVLKGQNITDFKASVDGDEARASFVDANEHAAQDLPKLGNIDRWISWASPKLHPIVKEFSTNISISYIEPLKFTGNKARFTYVLRSGALWKGGVIGEGSIVINVPSGYKLGQCTIPSDGASNSWSFKELHPTKDLTCDILKN